MRPSLSERHAPRNNMKILCRALMAGHTSAPGKSENWVLAGYSAVACDEDGPYSISRFFSSSSRFFRSSASCCSYSAISSSVIM